VIRQLKMLGIVALSRDTMLRPAPGRRRRHQAELTCPAEQPDQALGQLHVCSCDENSHGNTSFEVLYAKGVQVRAVRG